MNTYQLDEKEMQQATASCKIGYFRAAVFKGMPGKKFLYEGKTTLWRLGGAEEVRKDTSVTYRLSLYHNILCLKYSLSIEIK